MGLLHGFFENDLKESEVNYSRPKMRLRPHRLEFCKSKPFLRFITSQVFLFLGLGIWLFRLNGKSGEQNRNLAQKSKELEKLIKQKISFFNYIGHDLRVPVDIVKSIVDLLVKRLFTIRGVMS